MADKETWEYDTSLTIRVSAALAHELRQNAPAKGVSLNEHVRDILALGGSIEWLFAALYLFDFGMALIILSFSYEWAVPIP